MPVTKSEMMFFAAGAAVGAVLVGRAEIGAWFDIADTRRLGHQDPGLRRDTDINVTVRCREDHVAGGH